MKCYDIEPDIVDWARNRLSADRASQLAVHVRDCPSCNALLERERAMSIALRRLAHDTKTASIGPDVERALMARVDALWQGTRRRRRLRVWGEATAAMVLVCVGLGWVFTRSPAPRRNESHLAAANVKAVSARDTAASEPAPAVAVARNERPAHSPARHRPTRPRTIETTDFIEWPGAAGWTSLESGEVMRVELPVSMLPSLGVRISGTATGMVPADVLIGQDGFTRAVRLVR